MGSHAWSIIRINSYVNEIIRITDAGSKHGLAEPDRPVDSGWICGRDLQTVLDTLRAHEADLRRLGVSHAAVFGSVARGEAGATSDVDVLVDLDENNPIGVFEYARMKLYVTELLEGSADVVNRGR